MSKPIRFGLDISDHSVEVLSLSERKGRAVIEWAGRTDMPSGIVSRGVILDQDGLAQVLNRLLIGVFGRVRGRLQAGLSVPETQVFSRVFPMPIALEREMAAKAAMIGAADVFPVHPNDSLTAMVELPVVPGSGNRDFFLAAVDRRLVESYLVVLGRAGVEVTFVEPESAALSRSLVTERDETVMVVDIGAAVTNMFVNDRGGIRLVSSVGVGGDSLNAALETKLGLSPAAAERAKRQSGFLPTGEESRAFLVLQQPMATVIGEMAETVDYHLRKSGRPVRKIVLIGGNSLLPGIVDYVSSNFPDVPVAVGHPFGGIDLTVRQRSIGQQEVLFSAAAGTAWRAAGLRHGWEINFLLTNKRQTSGLRNLLGLGRKTGLALSHMVRKLTGKTGKAEGKAAGSDRAVKPRKAAVRKVRKEAVPEPAVSGADGVSEIETVVPPAVEPPKEVDRAETAYGPGEVTSAEGKADPNPESGQGIGDVLTGMEETDPKVEPEGEPDLFVLPPDGAVGGEGERMSVDSILSRAKENEMNGEGLSVYGEEPDRSGRGKTVALVVLVVVLAVATAGGIFMMMRKSGMVAPFSFLSSGQEGAGEDPEVAEEAAPPVPQSVSLTVLLGVERQPEGPKPFVLTRTVEAEREGSGSFVSTGQVAVTTGRSEGTITIVNTDDRPYDFVATTRFVTEDGILFRLKFGAAIPANGEVDAAVVADQAGAEYDIGPSRFTVPGLSAELQSLIWGESRAAMTGGSGMAKVVTEADLAKAKADIFEDLEREALADLGEIAGEDGVILSDLMTSEEVSFTAPKVGDLAGGFTATLKARFRALVVPQGELDGPLIDRLVSVLPVGENQADYDIGLPRYTVEAYDTMAGLAEVRVEADISRATVAPPIGN
ncbi:pilus assembly protein PilM [Candidatus Uhrbacteria bacterium]|nr:pilus assembly protein PilM [Candidatus Uhrbacteria bacterium]